MKRVRASRNYHALVPGFRAVDASETDPFASGYLVPNAPIYNFTNPNTGEAVQAQNNRAGWIMPISMGFKTLQPRWMDSTSTSQASIEANNRCVFPGEISGDDICAGTNGLNREEFDGTLPS